MHIWSLDYINVTAAHGKISAEMS